jgi:glycerol-3-phosphate dehydrogenase
MAQDTIDQAATLADLEDRDSVTRTLQIHGFHRNAGMFGDLWFYGSDGASIRELVHGDERLGERLHERRPTLAAQVVWAVRSEMARTVEDVLSRRTRDLLIDARASIDMAPAVARLMAEELERDDAWRHEQVEAYRRLARQYLIPGTA